ncbi:MAG: peptide-methionine (S)-S-oxide reductase MsrA [Flavobacteriales bacterium]|nr:peptide-methionine (S)-S-oxide reductase MsrA [Flavobacteriales bacterium]
MKNNNAVFIVPLLLFCLSCTASDQNTKTTDKEQIMNSKNLDSMTVGAGCFWCVEAIFTDLKGVEKVVSGYMGGRTANPTYKEVCSGTTGHVEVARIWFDPAIISYDQLLEVFWHAHDPTTLNRQGNDVGEQYRSVIFYHNEAQKQAAVDSKDSTDQSGLWPDPIVTAIEPAAEFYAAEDYHQNYFANNGSQPYCSFVIAPKVAKFRKEFKHLLKSN